MNNIQVKFIVEGREALTITMPKFTESCGLGLEMSSYVSSLVPNEDERMFSYDLSLRLARRKTKEEENEVHNL